MVVVMSCPPWTSFVSPSSRAKGAYGPAHRSVVVSQERTEAVVLRGVDFSETSRIVTFLTPDRGKVACMAAGARRSKSSLSGVLDTFNRLEIVYYWKDGRSVQRLAEASVLDTYPLIKADLDKLVCASFPLEIAYKAAQENEPSEALYSTLVSGLVSMAQWAGDGRTHARGRRFGCCRARAFKWLWRRAARANGCRFRTNMASCRRLSRAIAGWRRALMMACARWPRIRRRARTLATAARCSRRFAVMRAGIWRRVFAVYG